MQLFGKIDFEKLNEDIKDIQSAISKDSIDLIAHLEKVKLDVKEESND